MFLNLLHLIRVKWKTLLTDCGVNEEKLVDFEKKYEERTGRKDPTYG